MNKIERAAELFNKIAEFNAEVGKELKAIQAMEGKDAPTINIFSMTLNTRDGKDAEGTSVIACGSYELSLILDKACEDSPNILSVMNKVVEVQREKEDLGAQPSQAMIDAVSAMVDKLPDGDPKKAEFQEKLKMVQGMNEIVTRGEEVIEKISKVIPLSPQGDA